jgi:hypothetical protein
MALVGMDAGIAAPYRVVADLAVGRHRGRAGEAAGADFQQLAVPARDRQLHLETDLGRDIAAHQAGCRHLARGMQQRGLHHLGRRIRHAGKVIGDQGFADGFCGRRRSLCQNLQR